MCSPNSGTKRTMKSRLFLASLAVFAITGPMAMANAVVDSPGAAGVLGDGAAAAAQAAAAAKAAATAQAAVNASLKSKAVQKSSVVVNNTNAYTGQSGLGGSSGNTSIETLAPLLGSPWRLSTAVARVVPLLV